MPKEVYEQKFPIIHYFYLPAPCCDATDWGKQTVARYRGLNIVVRGIVKCRKSWHFGLAVGCSDQSHFTNDSS